MAEWLLPAIVQGTVAGAVFYGATRVELRWLRRDVDAAHARLNRHDERLLTVERAKV